MICGDVGGNLVIEKKNQTMISYSNLVLIFFVDIDELYDQRRFFQIYLYKIKFHKYS